VALALVLVGYVVIGVTVSTSGVLQPTVPTGRASKQSSHHAPHILVRTRPIRPTTTHTTGTHPRRTRLPRRSVIQRGAHNR
jgi:hypothetical protein